MAPSLTPSSIAMTRLEASISGESALIDREHGRVLWESGGSTIGRLPASVAPKLDEMGAAHVKAKILTGILLIGLVGMLVRWVHSSQGTQIANKISRVKFIGSLLVFLAKLTVLRIPTIHPWFLFFVWIAYMLESYTCSTREFLSHTMDDIEPYLEELRNETPVVTWNVRCFHYEGYTLPQLDNLLALARRKSANATNDNQDTVMPNGSSFSRLRRKVVTSQASATYEIKHCQDKTVAGIWKRAPIIHDASAPFTKLVMSKLLVLSNDRTRQDYMKQQSQFVSEHGQEDEYAEFSTNIHVPGFRRRVLAVRPHAGNKRKFSLSTFWISTLLLMTVPFRMWFANQCDEVRVTIVKETFLTPPRRIELSQRSWWSSFYTTSNSSKILAEDETFRDMMRQARLYGATGNTVDDPETISTLLDDPSVANRDMTIADPNSTNIDSDDV